MTFFFCSCFILHPFSAASPSPSFPFHYYPFHRYFYFSLLYWSPLFRPWTQTAKHGPHSSSTLPHPRATLTRIWPLYTRVSILSTPYINPDGLPPLLKQQQQQQGWEGKNANPLSSYDWECGTYTLGVTAEIQLGLWCCDGFGRISEGVSLGEGRIREDAHCVQTLSSFIPRV